MTTTIQIQNVTFDDLKMFIESTVKDSIKGVISPSIDPNELITRKEAAKVLKVSLVTLNDWSKRGLIQPYKIGGQVRYKRHEVANAVNMVKTLKFRRG